MGKLILLMFSFLMLALLVGSVSAQAIWTFDNFENHYKVYKSATCNVQGTKTCPNELGWQGRKMTFTFKLNGTQNITEIVEFNLYVLWFIDQRPIDIYVNGERIVKDFVVTGNGVPVCYPINETTEISYCASPGVSFEFSKSLLKSFKKNKIKIVMKDVRVGYGRPPQGFVIGSVSLIDKS